MYNQIIYLLTGKRASVIDRGASRVIVPFLGIDCRQELPRAGFGFETGARAIMYEFVNPLRLFQAHRAMRILQELTLVEDETLRACWYAASRTPSSADVRCYQSELMAQFGGREALEKFRQTLLAEPSGFAGLDEALTLLRNAGVQVSPWELRQEVVQHGLPVSSEVQRILCEFDSRRSEHTLPAHEDLPSALFVHLGMEHFFVGPSVGVRGFFFGHVSVAELDFVVAEHACPREGMPLQCVGSCYGGRLSALRQAVEHPRITVVTGTFTFVSVRIVCGRPLIRTRILDPAGQSDEQELPVSTLRELITGESQKPVAVQQGSRLLSFLRQIARSLQAPVLQ